MKKANTVDVRALLATLEDPERKPTMLEKIVDTFGEKVQQALKKNAMQADYTVDPVDWIAENFFVERPRDVKTGEILSPGPVRLADYQGVVLREALKRQPSGKLTYSTIVWSEPKKSGKTAIAAAVGLYMACNTPNVHIYCLANDGKQSADRIFKAMSDCLALHQKLGGPLKNNEVIWSPPTIRLENGTTIEAIPCDAAGEAGSEPFMTIWSELWGFRQAQKERLWTELTIPPTLWGYAMRWVESYAGYEGESTTLWNLYQVGESGREIIQDFPMRVTESANQLTYWSHAHRQVWQTPEYYASEAALLTPSEFDRIHNNNWTTSESSFLDDISLWDRLENATLTTMPRDDTPVVIALDASVSHDYSALVVVKRHPEDEWDTKIRRVCVCGVWTFVPPKGGKIDQSATFEPLIRELCESNNVVAIAYDPYQLEKLAGDLAAEGLAPFKAFGQGPRRLQADKQLYDLVIHKQIFHNGSPELRSAIQSAAAKTEGEHLRIVKKSQGRKIDPLVATSMAVDELLNLNVL